MNAKREELVMAWGSGFVGALMVIGVGTAAVIVIDNADTGLYIKAAAYIFVAAILVAIVSLSAWLAGIE